MENKESRKNGEGRDTVWVTEVLVGRLTEGNANGLKINEW